jgi:hypothetical protein
MEGWITLHRKLLEWEWYDDLPTCRLFIHLLLRANFKPCKWHGQTLNEGELITSIGSLSEETGLTERQVRTALDKLKSTGEIDKQTTNKYTLVKVRNYAVYQGYDKQAKASKRQTNDKQMSNKRQTNDNSITNITNKQGNNATNITSETPAREAIWEYAPDVLMTDEQACKLIDWCSPEELEQYVVNLQEYITEGHKVHNCFETICRWKERDSTTRRTRNASTV